MKKLLLPVVITAAAVFPTSALAGTFSGTVVASAGGKVAVAAKSGIVRTVHTRAHPRLGAVVRVTGSAVRSVGLAHHARIHGVVVKRVQGITFVSAGGTLLAIRSHAGRRLASLSASSDPAPGTVVTADVSITNGQLVEQSMTEDNDNQGDDNDDQGDTNDVAGLGDD